MGRPVVSNTTPTGQIVGSDGKATYPFIKWMQNIGSIVNSAFDTDNTYQGPIGADATIDGRATLASIVQFIDTGGVVEAPGIDFSRAYIDKDTDHITDGIGHPLAGGKVAFAALVASAPASGQTIEFNGTVWLPVAIAESALVVANQWINSYNASTGAFTASQPAFSNIAGAATPAQIPALSALSGQITMAQLPSAGLSVTVVTAKLTTGGVNGSMTFTNGILTAQVQAT